MKKSRIFVLILLLISLIVTNKLQMIAHAVEVSNMELYKQWVETHNYDDGNTLSYAVEWYFVKGYVAGEERYYWAVHTRIIPDAASGDDYEQWYVYEFKASFEDLSGYLAVYDIDPGNPLGCVDSWSGGVSTTVNIGLDGPSVDVGLSYSVSGNFYTLSVEPKETYPETTWIYKPCSIVYDSAWEAESVAMYMTTSNSVYVENHIGAVYAKDVKECVLSYCWWELAELVSHEHIWYVELTPP